MERIECRIAGRVQMVMYRDFAARAARKLGVVGRVKNEDDGSVSLVAEGEAPKLEEYLALLAKGPILAHVEDVSLSRKKATGEFSDFQIVY